MSPDSPSLDPQPYTVNPGPDDDDPINNDRRSSTTSVASDFNNLKEIYGRLFKGESWQPVDNMHRDYEMSLHQLISGLYEPLAGLKLFHAPLESNGHPQWKVLDVGTGFGFWAVDFADQFQSASVVGIDVSPGMPDSVPPNAQFQVEDVSRFPWTLEDNYFDFIFIRNFGGNMDTDKWPQFYREVYRCLKPGGWIEHIEAPPVVAPAHGGIITQNSPCHVWNNFFFAAASKTGRGFEAPDLESMSSAGFTDMKTRVQTLPIGVWPKDESFKRIGAVMQKLLCNNLDGLALRLAWDLGFGTQEMQMVFMQVRRDLQRPDNLFCIECSMAWARKPGAT